MSCTDAPLRICHIACAEKNGTYQWGGGQTSVRDLAIATKSRGHEVHVVAPEEFLIASGLEGQVGTTAMRVVPQDLPRLVRVLRRGRFDVAVSHLLRSVVVGSFAAKLARVPARVSNLHNSLQQEFDNVDSAPFKHAVYREAFRMTLAGSGTATVAISRSVAGDLARYDRIRPEKIAQIDNWVADTYAPVSDNERTRLRAELGIASTDRLILFVGRLEHQKHPELFVAAAQRLDAHHSAIVVGDGVLRPELESSSAAHGGSSIRFVGHRTDPSRYMSAADVVVIPSRFEGFGRVAVEALSTGTPVVCSGVVGLRDVLGRITTEPGDVEFVDGEDAAAWAATIAASAAPPSGPRDRERRHAAAISEYSISRAVDGYIALYRSMLRGRSSSIA